MPPYLPETTRSYPSIWLVVLAGVCSFVPSFQGVTN